MKPKDNIKIKLAWIWAGIGVAAVILFYFASRTSFVRQLVQRLVNEFGRSYRFTIAYVLGIVLLAGVGYWLVQYLKGNYKNGEEKEDQPVEKKEKSNWLTRLASDPAKLNQNIKQITLGVVITGMGAFSVLPFTHAFLLASFLVFGMCFLLKEDKKKIMLMGALIVVLFWSPYLIKGPDTHVKIFDNLDCHVPQTKILAQSGKAFSLDPETKLDPIINGLHLSGVDSGFNVMTWLFMIFPPFLAYALNELLLRIAAFFGMFFLLRDYVVKPQKQEQFWIIVGAAACFACIPFYPAGGVSIAGIPFLLFAFFNILQNKHKYTDFIIIVAFPFYSKLALAGLFIAVILFVIFLIHWLRKKEIHWIYLGSLVAFSLLYTFTHFHLVYSLLFSDVAMFREEISVTGTTGSAALKSSTWNFLFDRVNVSAAQQLFVIGTAALAVFTAIKKKLDIKLLAALIGTCVLTSLMWGFKYWTAIMPLREKFQILNAFDFSRFYWLNPFIWYVVFALALVVISKLKRGKIIATVLIIGQALFLFVNYSPEFRYQLGVKTSFAGSARTHSLTFREFYSPALFKDIQEHIAKPASSYRVVNFGLHPGITQFNGFYTLDVYTDVYPLEYKHKFRKIMEKELDKSPELQRVFDGNAKRCFLMAAELHGNSAYRGLAFSRGITKDDPPIKIENLELDTNALKDLGGEYIISAVEIVNYKQNNLKLDGIFKSRESPWKIYLYRVLQLKR